MRVKKTALIIVTSFFYLLVLSTLSRASEGPFKLDLPKNNLCDKASLQRGARTYMNYCSGCHSLQFMRFDNLAMGMGIIDKEGAVLEKLVNRNLNFISDKISDPIRVALPPKEGALWFGVTPPDLSLVARSRGTPWVYTYLRSFYLDPKRPWGVNNTVFPEVGMPNVLEGLQGTQVAHFKILKGIDEMGQPYEKKIVDHLSIKKSGSLTQEEFDQVITDLVNFLEYVGEPHKLQRKKLGVWVLLFLAILTLFAYLLKREYWKNIH